MPLGRIVFAFNGSKRMLTDLAMPSGPRPILLSYYYLQGRQGLEMLERWRRYSEPWPLFLDSGVYSLQGKLGIGLNAASSKMVSSFTQEEKDNLIARGGDKKEEVDRLVDGYIDFLIRADGLWDYAIEMDVDNFLGLDQASQYYAQMLMKLPKKKILKVWHQAYRDLQDWEDWCKDPDLPYLCMEGGTTHGRDPYFYHRFIELAHKFNKKVHILALTVPEFMRVVDVDTSDSSTFINGGRFGSVKTPRLGEIVFSVRTDLTKVSSSSANHYSRLTPEELEYCVGWFAKYGFTLDDILHDKKSHFYRSLMNIYWFDEVVDLPCSNMPINQSFF